MRIIFNYFTMTIIFLTITQSLFFLPIVHRVFIPQHISGHESCKAFIYILMVTMVSSIRCRWQAAGKSLRTLVVWCHWPCECRQLYIFRRGLGAFYGCDQDSISTAADCPPLQVQECLLWDLLLDASIWCVSEAQQHILWIDDSRSVLLYVRYAGIWWVCDSTPLLRHPV
jgi:hypothetical protein